MRKGTRECYCNYFFLLYYSISFTPVVKHTFFVLSLSLFSAMVFPCIFIRQSDMYKWLERWREICLERPCHPNTSEWKIHTQRDGWSCAVHFQLLKRHNYTHIPVGLKEGVFHTGGLHWKLTVSVCNVLLFTQKPQMTLGWIQERNQVRRCLTYLSNKSGRKNERHCKT